mmetsp:Transcript_37264/g.35879  ORF Transcript_37264/g.35879 Transcript_37264/m.35879 type:complete len:90 (-) Transcript_37264:5-274(-)
MMIITSEHEFINDFTAIYFGSHNFSPSAWGTNEKDGEQVKISNWELGVLFMPEEGSSEMKNEIIESLNVRLPPQLYSESDVPFIADIIE